MVYDNEEIKVKTTFTPLKKKEYIIDIPIYAQSLFNHLDYLVGVFNPGSGANKDNLLVHEN